MSDQPAPTAARSRRAVAWIFAGYAIGLLVAFVNWRVAGLGLLLFLAGRSSW